MTVVAMPVPGQKPTLVHVSDSYFILDCEAEGMHLHAQRVVRNKYGELRCTLEVRSALAGTPLVDDKQFVLNRYDNINLSAPGSRKTLAADLARSARTNNKINWHGLLDKLAFEVSAAEQTGQPAVLLSKVERPSADAMFDIDGFRLLKRHPTILFGDGGSMKSYLALHWAGRLCQMGFRPALFDWELDAADHKERLIRLFGNESQPDIVYVRCSRPLVYEIDRLVQVKHDHQIDFVICDSIAFACHGKPEDAEIASGYFRALRQLEVGSLSLAHITKGENNDQRPFGSAFWFNGARCLWFAKSETADETGGGKARTIGLFNRKVNMGAPMPSVGFQFTFEPEQTHVKRVELSEVEALAGHMPLWQRIRHVVKTRPMGLGELAEELNANLKSIEKAVNRKSSLFTLVPGPGGVNRVTLIDRRAS